MWKGNLVLKGVLSPEDAAKVRGSVCGTHAHTRTCCFRLITLPSVPLIRGWSLYRSFDLACNQIPTRPKRSVWMLYRFPATVVSQVMHLAMHLHGNNANKTSQQIKRSNSKTLNKIKICTTNTTMSKDASVNVRVRMLAMSVEFSVRTEFCRTRQTCVCFL